MGRAAAPLSLIRHLFVGVLLLTVGPACWAKTLTWSYTSDIQTLDPHVSHISFTNAFLGNIYETLVRMDDHLVDRTRPGRRGGSRRARPLWRVPSAPRRPCSTMATLLPPMTWCSAGHGCNTPGRQSRCHGRRQGRCARSMLADTGNRDGAAVPDPAECVVAVSDHGSRLVASQRLPRRLATSPATGRELMRQGTRTAPGHSASCRVEPDGADRARGVSWTGGTKPRHNLDRVTYHSDSQCCDPAPPSLISGAIDATVELPLQDVDRVRATPGLAGGAGAGTADDLSRHGSVS